MRDRALDMLLEPLVRDGQEDPETVADAVLSQLDEGERERILREVVLVRVKRSISARGPRQQTRPLPPAPRPLPRSQPVEAPVSPVVERRAPMSSQKVAGIRDWWSTWLSQQVELGNRTKPVGDCTADDIDVLARQRMAAAQRTAKNAQGMAAIAALMREHKVRTVKDLPRAEAQRALTQ